MLSQWTLRVVQGARVSNQVDYNRQILTVDGSGDPALVAWRTMLLCQAAVRGLAHAAFSRASSSPDHSR